MPRQSGPDRCRPGGDDDSRGERHGDARLKLLCSRCLRYILPRRRFREDGA